MKKPEWGLFPESKNPVIFWGARAVITRGQVELMWDRQSFAAEESVSEENKEAFLTWIDYTAIPHLNECVAKRNTKHIEFQSENGTFHCIAEDRGSGGYLYIGAYATNFEQGGAYERNL